MRLIAAILGLFFSFKAFSMEFTNGLVLETKEGLQVGFALGAPSFKVNSGDCVFVLLPATVNVIETPLGIIVSELKVAGEHSWRKENGGVIVHSGNRILLVIDGSGTVLDANGKHIGNAKPLPEKR